MSSILTTTYDTDDQNQFSHNTDEITIDGSGATLKNLDLQGDEMYVATGKLTANADRADGSPVTNYFTGSAFWDSGNKRFDFTEYANGHYMSLNDDSGRDGITPLTPTAHFNFGTTGCVRGKFTFNYSGTPSGGSVYLWTTGDTVVSNGLGSLLTLNHDGAGNLRFVTRNSAAAGTFNANFGAFNPTMGQEYEFEMNIDSSVPSAELFIDGVSVGTNTISSSPSNRDYFYVGTYYVGSFASNFTARDIQIFEEIQHTADFAGEIPRTVRVYTEESRVVPSETVTVEGISEMLSTSSGTGNIRYQMKIDNSFYYFTAGAVTASDGTYAQSSSLSDWQTNISILSDFVSNGARVTMVPMFYSGADGSENDLLVDTTITYNFFALPADCNQCTLYGFVKDNCDDVVSGTVRVWVKKPILTQGNVVSFDETVDLRFDVIGVEGYFEMPLIIPENSEDVYQYEIKWVDDDDKNWKKKGTLLIPNATSVLFNNAVVS